MNVNQEASGLIPTGGSSFFIHLLWYHLKEQYAVLFALFSIISFDFSEKETVKTSDS